MLPGLISPEIVSLPSVRTMEESLFPPIARKSAISVASENDPYDYCNPPSQRDRKSLTTRGSVPGSFSASPMKFPPIDRANSTSIASLPGSRANRHRTSNRELRANYCRSPSCPSNLGLTRTDNRVEFKKFNRNLSHTDAESSDVGSTDVENTTSKLPSIFTNDNAGSPEINNVTTRRERNKTDKLNSLSLRRSDSFFNAFPQNNIDNRRQFSNRDTEQRQGQTAALLLPLRPNAQTNKKKKKRRARKLSDSDVDAMDTTPRNGAVDNTTKPADGGDSDLALNIISRESERYDEDLETTPRAIEISSSRKVKQWMSNNQKEGHIKV
ncbi:uncharacterized protein LOC127873045 [Dreissena polymorpha]|uniref:Uncharacterized protein n=1 Tax=Dreissena polymorpha TaxID=45954 RepID=A0A9D4QVS4_DREPO|nr:uncharacterized protein LOC127873045 [Dreissena polymorpha]XP_052272568.1 uncharacterized protein LOC127873045 [Dreissena polymorpha]KAH3845354.1 hypothetical protein DPMN_087634 [Dreissena polymorpha]